MSDFDRDMFVDNNQIRQLESNDWQVIFGRRGTGKTTLLNAFSDHIGLTRSGVYSIFIDLRECVPSASGVTQNTETDFELALGYFYEFIRRFAKSLLDEYTDGPELSPLQRLIRSVRGSHKPLDDLVLDICEIAEYYPMRVRAIESTESSSLAQVRKSSSGMSTAVEGSVSSAVPSLTIALGNRNELEKTRDVNDSSSTKYVFDAARRYQPLKRKLEELLNLIESDRLYILIDEWADLNRIRNDNVQPIFAELLRKTFGGSEKISVKIASIKGATRLNLWNRQGGVGLELGADIFEACDLDQIYLSDENSISFFTELLFKRLCKVNNKLRDYSLKDERGSILIKPPLNFFSFFMKNEEIIPDIVKGGGKIPRDFISLFCFCANAFGYQVRPEWRRGAILKQISSYSIQHRHEIVSGGDEKGVLFYRIVELARRTESRIFVISRNLSSDAKRVVADLYHSRLIHPVSPADVPLHVRTKFDCFYVDYGYFLEAQEYTAKPTHAIRCPFTDDTDQSVIEAHQVQVEDIVGRTITCPHNDCGEIFRSTAKS